MGSHSLLFPLVILFFGAFVFLSFFKPKHGLFIVLLSRPVLDSITPLRVTVIPFIGINALQFIGIALPFVMLATCLLRQVPFFKSSASNVYLIFLLSCIPSVFVSDGIVLAFAGWLRLLILWGVLIFAVDCIKNRQDVEQVVWVILISSIYPMIRFLVDYFAGVTVVIGGIERVLGGYFHMSIISCMFVIFVPSYLYFIFVRERLTDKVLLSCGLCMIIVFIYMTQYRTALFGLLALGVTFGFLRRKYALLMTVFAVSFCIIVFIPYIQERFQPLGETLINVATLIDPKESRHDGLMSGRFGLWRGLLTTYLYDSRIENVFFGFGVDPSLKNIVVSPHNDFIALLFQYGFITPILFLFFIICSLRLGLRNSKHLLPQLITSLIVGLLVMSMAHGTFMDVRNLLYLGTYLAVLIKYEAIYVDVQSSKG